MWIELHRSDEGLLVLDQPRDDRLYRLRREGVQLTEPVVGGVAKTNCCGDELSPTQHVDLGPVLVCAVDGSRVPSSLPGRDSRCWRVTVARSRNGDSTARCAGKASVRSIPVSTLCPNSSPQCAHSSICSLLGSAVRQTTLAHCAKALGPGIGKGELAFETLAASAVSNDLPKLVDETW